MLTHTQENYLKEILRLQQELEKGASTKRLSELMGTSASSVSLMIRKLATKKLVDYQKYQGATLTDTGEKHALAIIRRYRLWETFLTAKLGFNWCEVHELAEQLKHVKSEKLIDEIDRLLSYPTANPYGNPIPDKNGNLSQINKYLLAECNLGSKCILIGVKDSSPNFLRYLDAQQVKLGLKFVLHYKEDFDKSIEIAIKNKLIKISNKIASNLYVYVKGQ
ncbi:metal-dependent transcriptional regulator [Maribacter sp. ACAM166]|nr:metal-dependent transcriptional regulator [Maribacter sp. ACAM166]